MSTFSFRSLSVLPYLLISDSGSCSGLFISSPATSYFRFISRRVMFYILSSFCSFRLVFFCHFTLTSPSTLSYFLPPFSPCVVSSLASVLCRVLSLHPFMRRIILSYTYFFTIYTFHLASSVTLLIPFCILYFLLCSFFRDSTSFAFHSSHTLILSSRLRLRQQSISCLKVF